MKERTTALRHSIRDAVRSGREIELREIVEHVRETFGTTTTRTVQRNLARMAADGEIVREGNTTNYRYKLPQLSLGKLTMVATVVIGGHSDSSGTLPPDRWRQHCRMWDARREACRGG